MEKCCFKGRFCHKQGFTLIELLVVVLIIGILAAIALPQYNKAVWKSRYTQAKTLAKSIATAEEAYFLTNGEYTSNFNELDIEIPTSKSIKCPQNPAGTVCKATFSWGYCTLVTNPIPGRNNIQCDVHKNGREYLTYALLFEHGTWSYGKAICVAYGETGKPAPNDINYQICSSETSRSAPPGTWGANASSWKYDQ